MMKEEPTLWSEDIVCAHRNMGLTRGGIPFPRKVKDRNGKVKMINDYTTYVKFLELMDNDEMGKETILFIDEINK